MAPKTVSILSVSLPYRMLRGEQETYPRSFGLSAELKKAGVQRGYAEQQMEAIQQACADYIDFAKRNELSYWADTIMRNAPANHHRQGAHQDHAHAQEEIAALEEKAVEEKRRLGMIAQLQDIMQDLIRARRNARV